jgi:RNA polymerase sigma factor (sigma-70 family)
MKQEKKLAKVSEETQQRVEVEFCIEDLIISRELKEKTQRVFLVALNQLPWRQREAVYLRYYNGLNTREIAEIMGVAQQTILNTLYQALKKLRTIDDVINLKR